jgi:hypothetical protein
MSNNVTVQQDNNTTDAPGSASGTITAGAPVQSAGSVADQQQRAAQRASDAGAACGGTAQAYNVTVPYSGTTLCFGSAAGGAGASLTTLGQVLLDAVGTMGLQAKGNFSAQTNAAMALLSAASTQQHSQGKVEIFAGGGMAPGSCGSGAPASPGPNTPPAKTAEKVTEVACAATSAMKAYNDLQTNLQSSRDAAGKFSSATTTAERDALSQEGFAADLGIMKAGMDALKAGTGAGAQFASGTGKDALKVGGSVLEAGAGMAGAMSAMMKGDIGSAVSGLSGMVSGGSGVAAAAGGGGGADIEERASANIKMVAATKISGTAPVGIDFKTANKFSVNAALVVDFTTITWGAFAAAKFEVKSMGAVKTASSTLEMKAKATGKIDCKASFTAKAPLITVDGVTTVTKTLTVKGDSTLNANLQVDKNATLKGELLVQKTSTLKSTLTVHKASTLKANVTAEKNLAVKSDATINGKLRSKGAVLLG